VWVSLLQQACARREPAGFRRARSRNTTENEQPDRKELFMSKSDTPSVRPCHGDRGRFWLKGVYGT